MLSRARLPLWGRPRVRFRQMGHGKSGAEQGPCGPVETVQWFGRLGREGPPRGLKEDVADPGRTQSFAFETEVSNFMKRIGNSQVRVEFEAIDDDRLRQETDMFGPQIPVAFHVG